MKDKIFDGVVTSEIKFEHDHIVHKTEQPTENIILERNNELRKNAGAINDLGGTGTQTWGRQVASIPFVLWYKAIKDGYQLNAKDSKFANQELFRWLQTPEGKTCLVR